VELFFKVLCSQRMTDYQKRDNMHSMAKPPGCMCGGKKVNQSALIESIVQLYNDIEAKKFAYLRSNRPWVRAASLQPEERLTYSPKISERQRLIDSYTRAQEQRRDRSYDSSDEEEERGRRPYVNVRTPGR